MTYIPENKYYLKIASGFGWFGKYIDNKCYGKFVVNPMYEKGSDTLNFNTFIDNSIAIDTVFSTDTVFNDDGSSYSVPYTVNSNEMIRTYQFSFNVINNSIEKSFHAENINEEEFND